MAKSFIDKRVVFPPGKQKLFLERVGQQLTVAEMADICDCSERTIRDWRREKFSMAFTAIQVLSRRTKVSIPKNIRTHEAYAHLAEASRIGGNQLVNSKRTHFSKQNLYINRDAPPTSRNSLES